MPGEMMPDNGKNRREIDHRIIEMVENHSALIELMNHKLDHHDAILSEMQRQGHERQEIMMLQNEMMAQMRDFMKETVAEMKEIKKMLPSKEDLERLIDEKKDKWKLLDFLKVVKKHWLKFTAWVAGVSGVIAGITKFIEWWFK